MLTVSHLAVIRAALKFWDEEMSPHDPAIYTGYFDEPIGTGDWIKPAVQSLRAQLSSCQLRYAACSPDGAALASDHLFESVEKTQGAFPAGTVQIAAVLIFAAAV
jgi:hypothetical protein